MADEITLTLPRERDFHRVAHLVLGGLAVRLELTIENLEDLQIALETLLDTTDAGGHLTVAMRVDDDELRTVVGPLPQRLLAAIEDDAADGDIGLRRVLETTVDDVFVDGDHVTLTKKVTLISG